MIRHLIQWPLAFLSFVLVAAPASAQQDSTATRPNFLIIVVDDMGWSDLGFLGSGIRTPNIDALAARGTFLSSFYVAPTCSPTRSMLMTGVSNHAAGLGTMHGIQAPNQLGRLEYGAQLHDGVVTLAELLQASGYSTSMSGKWHIGIDEDQYPGRRGFEHSFGVLQGGASHFADGLPIHRSENVTYLENGHPVDLPPDFYSTYNYTDKIIEYIGNSREQPFFAYLAYTAPHDPLQVPDDWQDRYQGAFDEGPLHAKSRRASRLTALGLIEEGVQLAEATNLPSWLDGHKKPWEMRSVAERRQDARRMEIYAAMVEIVDQEIGRLSEYLESAGKLENTYIIFMSDNGAAAGTVYARPDNDREWVDRTFDLGFDQMGTMGSFTTMGREWANNSNTPFRLFKSTVAEGGIRSPMVIAGPSVPAGAIRKTPAHVTDIVPTVQDILDIEAAGQPIYREKLLPQGQSLLPILAAAEPDSQRSIVIELFGNYMVRQGKWKAIHLNPPVGSSEWELFDIVADPSETTNLADENPEVLQQLTQEFDRYVVENNVVLPEPRLTRPIMGLYEGKCGTWCQVKFGVAETLIYPERRNVLFAILGGMLLLGGFIIYRRRSRRKASTLQSDGPALAA